MTQTDDPLRFPIEKAYEVAQDADGELVRLSNDLWTNSMGEPGRHGPSRIESIKTRVGTNAIRRAEYYLKKTQPLPPELFGELVTLVPDQRASPKQNLQWLEDYAVASSRSVFSKRLVMCYLVLQKIVAEHPADLVIENISAFHLSGIHIEVTNLGRGAGMRELNRTAEDLAASHNRFGHVTDIRPGYRLSGVSEPLALLLEKPRSWLNGSYLLGAPLRELMQFKLRNFDEWIFMISILTKTMEPLWSTQGLLDLEGATRIAEHFEWLESYVADPCEYERVRKNIDKSPGTQIDGRTNRQDLQQALEAVRDKAKWPEYNMNRWNSVRMHIQHHELLGPGEVAQFEKTASPIPDRDNPIGYEITYIPQNGNLVAAGLVRDILARSGVSDDD